MKNYKFFNKINSVSLLFFIVFLFGLLIITACDENLPETGSLTDDTPPSAGFSFSTTAESNLSVKFTNLSSNATTYAWNFGDGNTSTEKEPTNTYATYGTYTVTLVSSDKLGVSSTATQDVKVVKGPYQPFILEPGFEDLQLTGGTGDGRDSWRKSSLGGVIQITSDPIRTGTQAAKLTGSASDQRIGYQLVTVEAESNYNLNFYYTMKNDQTGFLTVSVLSGDVETHQEAVAATIGSLTVNDQTDPNTYLPGKVSFSSGTSTQVAIYFFNEGSVESRLDDFTIDIAQAGAVPPSASFSSTQSSANFLEYSFTNSSVNATSYAWDFGDGNTSTDENPTHIYAMGGMYKVLLTAKNNAGTTATFSSDIDVQDPVKAGFTYTVDTTNYQKIAFMDTSVNATSIMWDFGDGFQSSQKNPTYTYAEDGTYTVKLTATSSTGLTDVVTEDITIAMGFVVEVLNGDFENGSSNWKISSFTGGNTNPFNSSSDGASENYSGAPTASKTKGAKWTSSTTTNPVTSSSRFAYQEVEVKAATTYIFEYSYAIKTDNADKPGGDRVIGEILDGQYTDGADALAASNTGNMVQLVGTTANGKGSFKKIMKEFTSTDDKVSIWIYAVTNDELYVDNVKIYKKP